MKYLLLLSLAAMLVTSCSKERMQEPVAETNLPFSEMKYKITVVLNWRNPQFTVPANVHVTALKGMVHARDTFLWRPGFDAGKGLEYVAEDGYDGFINLEIDSILAHGKALAAFTFPPPSPTGSIDTTLNFNTNFSCFSFVSMIAPSPDWFMGINSFNLIKNNQWIQEITIPVLLYDAGTEEGDVFGYDNPATDPQQPVKALTPANATVLANGNSSLAAIGTVRFIKTN